MGKLNMKHQVMLIENQQVLPMYGYANRKSTSASTVWCIFIAKSVKSSHYETDKLQFPNMES